MQPRNSPSLKVTFETRHPPESNKTTPTAHPAPRVHSTSSLGGTERASCTSPRYALSCVWTCALPLVTRLKLAQEPRSTHRGLHEQRRLLSTNTHANERTENHNERISPLYKGVELRVAATHPPVSSTTRSNRAWTTIFFVPPPPRLWIAGEGAGMEMIATLAFRLEIARKRGRFHTQASSHPGRRHVS